MKKIVFSLFLLAVSCSVLKAQKEGLKYISKGNLVSYMTFFASDELQGRETGTLENDAASLFIKSNLMRLGVKGIQGKGDYYQEVPMQRISIKNEFRINSEVNSYSNDSVLLLMPVPFSTAITSNIVFAGYGYMDEDTGYNDFKDIEVRDKIVLIMTGTPATIRSGEAKHNVFDEGEERKFIALMMMGAKAVFMVYNPGSEYSDQYASGLAEIIGDESVGIEDKGIIALPIQLGFITRHTANMILKTSGQDLETIHKKILSMGMPASFELEGITGTVSTTINKTSFKSRNVIGVIEGSDPVLKNKCLIYSAHLDHTGVANGKVFNGADDNASGSMALLEIAGAFMNLKKKPARTVVFAWVNGEEKGLLGSEYYVDNPVFPIDQTILNINLDMVGRSRTPADTGKVFGADLTVTGPRELELYSDHVSSELSKLIDESAAKAGIKLIVKGDDLEWGSSDHMSFRNKGVTALMFHSGIHADLHTERDEIEKIDFDKMERSARLCFYLGYKVANMKKGSKIH